MSKLHSKKFIFKSLTVVFLLLFFIFVFSNFAQAEAPPAPADISVESGCINISGWVNSINFIWPHIPSQDIKEYYILRDDGFSIIITNDQEGNLISDSSSFITWTDYFFTGGEIFTYKIAAVNIYDEYSDFSNPITKTFAYCPAPVLTLDDNYCFGLDSRVSLSWTDSGGISFFNIYRKEAGDEFFQTINQVPFGINNWPNNGLTNQQEYIYYIQAVGSGWELDSNEISATTLNCASSIEPSPPPVLSLENLCTVAGNEITITWEQSENTHYYLIHKSFTFLSVDYDINWSVDSNSFTFPDQGNAGESIDSDEDIGSIEPGIEYTYYIEAVNNADPDNKISSNIENITFNLDCANPGDLPGDPTNLSTQSRCDITNDPVMRFSWDFVADATVYYIWRKLSTETEYSFIGATDEDADTGTGVFDFDDQEVIAGLTYHYGVQARNSAGHSNIIYYIGSDPASVCVLPVAPVLLDDISSECSGSQDPKVIINWSQNPFNSSNPDSNTGYFEIYQESTIDILIHSTVDNTIYTYEDLDDATPIESNVNYTYYIKAIGAVGQTPTESNRQAIQVGWCLPTAPENLSAVDICDGSGNTNITLSWDNSKNTDHYELYRSDDGSLGNQISANAVSGIVNTVSGAVDTFYYTVRAIGSDGSSVADSLISITTQNCTLLASFSIDVGNSTTQCPGYDPYFHLVWEAVDSAEYYEVYREEDGTGLTELMTPLGTTNSYYDDNSIESGVRYYYYITAYKNSDSEDSDSPFFDIDWCPPDSPTALDNAQSCSGNQPEVSLGWTASLNTASYEVYRRLDNLAVVPANYIGTSASSPYLDNTVSNNGTYYYTVRAIGSDTINIADSTAYQVVVGNCQIPGQSQISLASLCNGPDPYVGLSWTAVSGAANYDIHKIQAASIIPGAGNLFLDDTVLLADNDDVVASGNTYSYVSLACSLGGCSSYNSPLDVTESIYVEYCDPELPVLAAVASCDGLGNSVVDLAWPADTTGNLDYYRVARDIGGVGFVVLDDNLINTADAYTNDQSNPSAPINPPADSTTYTYYLTTVGYNSDWATSTVDVLTYDCVLPSEPTITPASAECDTCYPFIHLDWTDVLDFSTLPETKYYEVQQDGTTIFNTQDIVGMWHFNGNTDDESIFENHGTNNGATFAAGNFGQALNFDGDDYVEISDDDSLQPSNQITIMAWVKLDMEPLDDTGIITKGTQNSETYSLIVRSGYAGYFRIHTINGSETCSTSNNLLDAENWHHLAAVYDGSQMIYYIDANLVANCFHSGNLLDTDYSIYMGRRTDAGRTNAYLRGSIDETVIYFRALTADEIKGSYRRGEHFSPTESQYNDYSVSSGNSYNYTVIAGNIGGENSDTAGPISVNWCDTPAPSDFVLSQSCDGSGNSNVTLDWDQEAPENVSHYIIERHNNTAGMDDTLESNLNSALRTYLDDSPPSNETDYDYRIVAVGNSGNYATSTEENIVTNDCALPSIPSITTYNPECNGVAPFIDLDWTNIANADYYIVSQDGSDVFDTRNEIAGLYHFDEGSGTDIEDATEIKENGSVVNGAEQWVAGQVGSALDFSNGGYVNIPDSDNSVFDFKNGFTIEAWINNTGSSGDDYILYKDGIYYLNIWNNEIYWRLYNAHCGDTCQSANCWIQTNINIDVGSWMHIAMVYDKNTLTIYKNGNEEIVSTRAYGLVYPVNNNFVRIGYSFNGAIDEVKIVGRALSAAEILTDYNDGNAGINLTVPLAGDVVDFNDYNVLANDDPWYLGESHTYEVRAVNLGGSVTSTPTTATFNNPADACLPGVSYQSDASAYCVADNPGVCYPYIHFEWADFMPGNSGINNADVRNNAYQLIIDTVPQAGILPTSGTYWCGGGRREHVFFQNDISGWGVNSGNYDFSLRITNVNGINQDSGIRSVNIPFCAAPSDITNFNVIPGCNGDQAKINLDWDDDSLGYTNSYYIVREKQGGGAEPSSLNYIESIDLMGNNHNEGLCYKDGIFYRTAYYNTAGGELMDSNGVSYDTESWSNDLNGIVWDSVENCFWFSDDQHNDIVKTDENFNFISSFDVSAEVYDQRSITTDGTYLYIVDSGRYEYHGYSGAIFVYNKDGSLHKKIDMSSMTNGSWNGHGIAYLDGYLYAGTDGGVEPESVYVINVSQIADGIASIQAIFDVSSYVCSYGVKGVATDGTDLFLADYCYIPFYKFSIVKAGNEIKYVDTDLVSEYEDVGDLEVNSAYDYYVLAIGDNYSYNISDTVAATTPSACYNAPLEPTISYVTPKCDDSLDKYIEVQWDQKEGGNNTDDYNLGRAEDTPSNYTIITGILDSDFGILSSGLDNCLSLEDPDSGIVTIICENYSNIIAGTGYKYYLEANGLGGTTQSADFPTDFIFPLDCNAVPDTPANFSVTAQCMGYCNGGDDNGNTCALNSHCDSSNCVVSFYNGGSEVLEWDKSTNAFQYVIGRDCGDGYDYLATIPAYPSFIDPDIIYLSNSIQYIDHVPSEYINEDCFYNVYAKGGAGDSGYTDLIDDTVPVCGNTPMPAQNLRLITAEISNIHIAWDDGTDIGITGDDPPTNPETGGEFHFQALRGEGTDYSSCKDGSFDDSDCADASMIYRDVGSQLNPSNSGDVVDFFDSYSVCENAPYSSCSDDSDCGAGKCMQVHEEGCYCYKIKSSNPAGDVYSSPFLAVLTPTGPPGGFILSKNLDSCEKLEISWTKAENYFGVENAIGYNVYRNTDNTISCCEASDGWNLRSSTAIESCYGNLNYDTACDFDADNDVDDDDFLHCYIFWDPPSGAACIGPNPECDLDNNGGCGVEDFDIFSVAYPSAGFNPNCDEDCSDGICYTVGTEIYKFTDYFNTSTTDEQFPPGEKYYYVVQGLPTPPVTDATDTNTLRVQPCPYLPEWRESKPE